MIWWVFPLFLETPISTQFCSWQVVAHLVLEKLNSRASARPGKQQIDPYSKLDGEELYARCPSWRSLNHVKGSLNHPKKVTKNCQVTLTYMANESNWVIAKPTPGKSIWFISMFLDLFSWWFFTDSIPWYFHHNFSPPFGNICFFWIFSTHQTYANLSIATRFFRQQDCVVLGGVQFQLVEMALVFFRISQCR